MEASPPYRTKNSITPNFTKSPPTQGEKLVRIRARGASKYP